MEVQRVQGISEEIEEGPGKEKLRYCGKTETKQTKIQFGSHCQGEISYFRW